MLTAVHQLADPDRDFNFTLKTSWENDQKSDPEVADWSLELILRQDYWMGSTNISHKEFRYQLRSQAGDTAQKYYAVLVPAGSLSVGRYRLEVEAVHSFSGIKYSLTEMTGSAHWLSVGNVGLVAAGLHYQVGDGLGLEYGLLQPSLGMPGYPEILEGVYSHGFCNDELVSLENIVLYGWYPAGRAAPEVTLHGLMDDQILMEKALLPADPAATNPMFPDLYPGQEGPVVNRFFTLEALSADLLEEVGREAGSHRLEFYFTLTTGDFQTRFPQTKNFESRFEIADAPLGADCQAALLPIELLDFLVVSEDNQVMIKWISAIEINSQFYTVERSHDLHHWQTVYEVHGQGNSSDYVSYQFRDKYPLPGISYYRLKQTDFDGSQTYSKVKTVRIHSSDISLYPNPVDDYLYYRIDDPDQSYDIKLFDVFGNCVFSTRIPDPSVSFQRVDLTKLPKGSYIIKYVDSNNYLSRTAKFIKL